MLSDTNNRVLSQNILENKDLVFHITSSPIAGKRGLVVFHKVKRLTKCAETRRKKKVKL
jgi:hypothetical protein